MSFPASDEPETPRLTPAVLWLIVLNVAVFFVQETVQRDLPVWLGFRGANLPAQWWTALTYMFVHAGLWHLAFNMYMLWAFGPRVERAWTTFAFSGYYLWCGLGGVLVHSLLVRDGALLVGASGALYGVLLAFAVRWPNEEVLFFGVVPMKVKWMVAMFVAIDLISGMAGGGGMAEQTAHWAHIGGAVFGGLYLFSPSAPSVDRLRQRVASTPDLGDEPPRPVPRSLPRPRERGSDIDEVVEKSKAATARPARPAPAPPRRPPPVPVATPVRPEALDGVLDKISQQGLDSLTVDERRLLEEASKRLREA
jgi:membrane associated rhomboid family serine protease